MAPETRNGTPAESDSTVRGSSADPDGNTYAMAQTLWSTAVTIDADADVTIPSPPDNQSLTPDVTLSPRPRHLSKRGEVAANHAEIDFELGDLLGRGGMGAVYTARQAALDRRIAVKMLNTEIAPDETAVGKFLSEAVVTGNLDHPNIVPVYDMGGTDDGSFFYAMKEISGSAWSESIGLTPLDDNLRILLAVSDAVAFAHSRGVLHRDLKPENVMLGAFGETLVVDWGLAITLGDDGTPEHDTGLAGTPAYMAPEMARCEWSRFGVATDVYLLGGILYEIVTGQKPHTGRDVYATISAAMENRITPSDKQGELTAIAQRALATNPADRYPSVPAFQEAIRDYQRHAESVRMTEACVARYAGVASVAENDLYREVTEIMAGFQQALALWPHNGEAINRLCDTRVAFTRTAIERGDVTLAQSELAALRSETERYGVGDTYAAALADLKVAIDAAMAQAAARTRLIRFSVVVAVMGALATVAITSAAYVLTRKERDHAIEARQEALAQREQAAQALAEARAASYYTQIALADNYIHQADPAHAESLIRATPGSARGWEWGYLANLCRRPLLTLQHPLGTQTLGAFGPDGNRLITVGADNRLTLWAGITGEVLKTLRADLDDIAAVALLPGSGDAVLVTREGALRTWSLSTATERTFLALEQYPTDILLSTISQDGTRVAAVTRNNRLLIWETRQATLERTAVLRPAPTDIGALAISITGDQVATGGRDGTPRIYDSQTGRLTDTLTPAVALPPISALAFTPSGDGLAAGTSSRIVSVWDIVSRRERMRLGEHRSDIRAIGFTADGTRLVSLGTEPVLRVWDATHFSTFLALTPNQGAVHAVAFSPAGESAAVATASGAVLLYDTADWSIKERWIHGTHAVTGLDFSRDGSRLLSSSDDGTCRVWIPGRREPYATLREPGAPIATAVFSSDSDRVLITDRTSASLWRLGPVERLATLPGSGGDFTVAAFSPDGSRLLTAGAHLILWDAYTGERLLEPMVLPVPARCAAFSPDGRRILTGDHESAWLRDARTGDALMELSGHVSAISCVSFTPDGRRALTGGLHVAKLWDTENGREVLTLRHRGGWVTDASFSPDGRHLLTAGSDGRARLWLSMPPDLDADQAGSWKQAMYGLWLKHHGLEAVTSATDTP